MAESQQTKWTTTDELRFIENIKKINVAENNKPSRLSELELLRQYVSASKRRVDWGKIDPVIVLAKVHEKIMRLMSGAAA